MVSKVGFLGLIFVNLFFYSSYAMMPSNPVSDHDFEILPNGKKLADIKVSNVPLSLSNGSGIAWTDKQTKDFLKIVQDSKQILNYPVQWVLMDLDSHLVLDQSYSATHRMFGASVAKIFVAATLLNQQAGELTPIQQQLMANMLVISSNEAWLELQNQIGEGNDDVGRQRVHEFTQKMGYSNTRGYQGTLAGVHGNELNARDLADFLYDTYHGKYSGAETVWKFMHTCRTGSLRGRKYISDKIFVGAKTGTYSGPSVNPDTGSTKNPDGSPYTVNVSNHVLVFNIDNHEYALTILANTGSDETAALLAGGFVEDLKSRWFTFAETAR